jgi:hypothetical protein
MLLRRPGIIVLWLWAVVSTGNDKGDRVNPEFFSWLNKDVSMSFAEKCVFCENATGLDDKCSFRINCLVSYLLNCDYNLLIFKRGRVLCFFLGGHDGSFDLFFVYCLRKTKLTVNLANWIFFFLAQMSRISNTICVAYDITCCFL